MIDVPSEAGPLFQFDDERFVPNTLSKGQHFLKDEAFVNLASELLPEGATYVEIGPGTGVLTSRLMAKRGKVIAYEADERLAPVLNPLVQQGLDLRFANFLEADVDEINAADDLHVVGNIPFQISEPLLYKLTDINFTSAVLLIGKKLSDAITETVPRSGRWTRMSLVANAFFDVERITEVPSEAFDPPPRVNGELVRILRKDRSSNWRTDAAVRSYRAIVEGQTTNSTIAKALKTVQVNAKGKAEARIGSKRTSHRAQRRMSRMALASAAQDYNTDKLASSEGKVIGSQDMLTLISGSVDKATLSQPLSGLSNSEVVKVCAAISAAVNRLQKR